MEDRDSFAILEFIGRLGSLYILAPRFSKAVLAMLRTVSGIDLMLTAHF